MLFVLTSNRASLLGSYPGELEVTGSRRSSHPLHSDYLDDRMSKMRRMDDDRPAMRRPSPDYDRDMNYMEQQQQEQNRFRSDNRAEPMMPEVRDDRQRKVVSIFDIGDRLRRKDVEVRGPVGGGGGSQMGAERFGGHRDEDEEMMTMQRARPLLRGSGEPRMGSWDDSRTSEREQPMPPLLHGSGERRMGSWDDSKTIEREHPMPPLLRGSGEPRMGSWDDSRTSEHEQPMSFERRMQEDRRMQPKNQPVPSLISMMDRGSRELLADRRQQRMPAKDPVMMREQGPKLVVRDRPGPTVQQSDYYQNEPENMPSGRPSSGERGPSYRDRDERTSWASERSERFSKFESEGTQSTQRQSNQPSQSSEQSDPVSLLLNLSQLLA